MKKTLFVLLLLISPVLVFAQGKYYVKTYHEITNKQLLSRLAKAKTDTMRLNLLNSLIMDATDINNPGSIDTGYINRLISINGKAHLINDTPYQLLLQGVLACRKHNYVSALTIYKQIIEAFDKQNINTFNVLLQMRWIFNVTNRTEEKLGYYTQKLNYYLQNKQYINAAACYHCIAGYYSYKSDNNMAINNYLKAGDMIKPYIYSWYTNEILVVGTDYKDWGNLDKALVYLKMGNKQLDKEPANIDKGFALFSLSEVEYQLRDYQQSLNYLDSLYKFGQTKKPLLPMESYYYVIRALDYIEMKRLPEALNNLQTAQKNQDTTAIERISSIGRYDLEYGYFKYYQATNKPQLAEENLLKAYQISRTSGTSSIQLLYLKELVQFYDRQKNIPAAWKYSELYNRLTDSVTATSNRFKVASYEFEQKENAQNKQVADLQQQHAVQEATIGQRNIIIWLSLAGLAAVCVLMVFIYRQLQVNKKTLRTLQLTQTQLIQSEKMASLGELTAGIAHEIQNPLNFVNNFSEVSVELVDEMQNELNNGDKDEAIAISEDIKQNLEKIRHHGKRADFIVKGMLQHSRTSTGEKQLTDINVLADEFLKLSYHGLRAKDKSFNAELVTNFDGQLPKVNIAQQDIGRVLLNLFNNAFYAVNQKQKTVGADYKPEVTVSTSIEKNNLVISVKDNGNGIPDAVKDKIMQPFFTTKPTGEGTGLGLSLSYDIVVKGHGGKISVDTKENEFTEFTVWVPIA